MKVSIAIINVIISDIYLLSIVNNIAIIIVAKTIPDKVEIIELALCFITSVSLDASIFGYFKFTINPKTATNIGSIIDINNELIISMNENLNEYIAIALPIIRKGIVIKMLFNILDFSIVLVLTGNDLSILILEPSKDILDEVIEVRHEVKIISDMKNFGIIVYISLILICSPPLVIR